MQQNRDTPDACLTSVHHSETKAHPLEVQSRAQHCLHAGVKERREAIIDAFWSSGKPALIKRAEKMGMCGVSPIVRFERGRRPALCPGRCRDRLCPLCRRLRGQQLRSRVKALVGKANSVRFVTLTQPRTDEPLGVRIDNVHKAFSRLRRLAAWKQRVAGGVFVVEATRGSKGDHWHVHLHLIIEGEYFPHAVLKQAWATACPGAEICDIKAIHQRANAVNYIAKYVSKGDAEDGWTNDILCEHAEGIHRRRLMGTFGKWHRVDVNEEREDDEPDTMPREGATWATLREALEQNTLDRATLVPFLWQMGACWRLLLRDFVDEPPPLTGWPGAAVFDPMVSVLLDVGGIEERPAAAPQTSATPPVEGSSLWAQHKI